MPRREDIERFTQVLNSLGDEPAIRAARSESIETVPAPGEESPPPEETAGAPGEAESLQDIFSSLSALPEGGEEETGAAGTAGIEEGVDLGQEEAPSAASSGEGLDFASLFGEEAAPEGIEDLEPKNLQSDLSELETLPDESSEPGLGTAAEPEFGAGVGEGTEEPTGEAAPGGGQFEDLGSFSLDAPEAGAGETPSPEDFGGTGFEAPQPDTSAEAGSFDLPNLDDLSFPEPLEGTPSEPGGASTEEPLDQAMPSFDEPMPSLDEPTPSFDQPLPSLEEPMPSLEAPSPDEILPSELAEEGAVSGFDLDAATLGEPGGGTETDQFPSGPEETETAAEAPGAAMESLGEESLGDLNLDEFSLPESAEQFGLPGAPEGEPLAPAAPARPRPERPRPERPRPAERKPRPQARTPAVAPGIGEGEIELTPEQFAQLKRVLDSLPRNLKIAVQDLIGEGTAAGPDLAALINLLLKGASAQEIATLAGRISGKRIRIPAGYEKRTGAEFEAEQRTFAYAFRENFLPLLRVIAITVLAGGLFGFLGYNYVYRPLFAFTNYRAGYAQIANDRFTLANERFARATSVWPLKRWYYSYAEAFAAKRQYLLAEHKYDDLLKAYPGDRKGTLDYARMESVRLADYVKADALLTRFLDTHHDDYDALLASGDNDLLWAERDKTKYEPARLAYAMLLDKYGARDELLFRMLRYFIRTDNGGEVERLRAFYATQPEVKIDAPVFAELGGYLVDHRRLDFAQDVLFRADKNQTGLYEVHYNLARYYRIVKSLDDEKKALNATVTLLDRTKNTDAVTRRRLAVEIDTHTRLGEYYYGTREYIPSEKELQTAIRLVENNQQMKLIEKNRLFGRPYAVLGNLYYNVQGDLQSAASQYQKAIDNLYTDPELTYKIGYIQYAQQDYKSALLTFTSAEDASAYPSGNEALAPAADTTPTAPPAPAGQPPQNLLFALGNTFYQRGDYFAAQGYFLRMLDRLETRKAALGFLHPEDRPDDRALLDSLVKVNNNLGVTMFRLAERTGDRKKKSEALVYLSAAAEIAGSLARSPDSVRRSENREVPSLNMRGIIYPVSKFDLQVYRLLPKDFQAVDW
jgi:TolA-binding protein